MLPIPQLELLTILVAIKLWKDKLRGHVLTIYSDSDTAVQVIKNRRSKVNFMQRCLKELFLCLEFSNITLRIRQVSGIDNVLADYFSRWHLDQRYGIQFLELTKYRMLKEKVVTDDLFRFTLLKSDVCL